MKFEIPEHVTWKNLDSGYVLLDLRSSNYYTLNETASFIWQHIIEEKDSEQISTLMLETYNCEQDHARKDIQEQVDFLIKENLLKVKN